MKAAVIYDSTPGRTKPFQERFRMLKAPGKHMTEPATSEHQPLFEQPAEFLGYMNHTVLAGTGS